MHITFKAQAYQLQSAALSIIGIQQEKKGEKTSNVLPKISKDILEVLESFEVYKKFKADLGKTLLINLSSETSVMLMGLGDKKSLTTEKFRRNIAKNFKAIKASSYEKIIFHMDSLTTFGPQETLALTIEAVQLADYSFEKYKSKKSEATLKSIEIQSSKIKAPAFNEILKETQNVTDSINYARDLINEVPNVLHSEEYAKRIEQDVKKNLKSVNVKILNKAAIKKENMNLLLAVNAGSAYEPRIVHLTYTPSKSSAKTKHIALVGKGITFDTGGYSLKPGDSMMGMKFDMGGSASVYAAFRAAVLNKAPYKLTCILAITDNAVSSTAVFPDSIIVGRNGVTVEILNTDAEGRLILADALDYACSQKPEVILDAATLTGACLVALGKEVCAVLSNNEKLVKDVKAAAERADEYVWELPMIQEYRDSIKSQVADIKNIGPSRLAGTAMGAVFLEKFVKPEIAWAHFDIAGVCDNQNQLPYCPANGASGIIIRTLYQYITK